jgi:hypothetical protein
MSVDFTYILDPDFPVVNRPAVTPTIDQVAVLEATRLVDNTGADQSTFTATTRPNATQAASIISQALKLTLADLPDYVPESVYPRVLQAVTLRSAVLIELSFFREQYHQGSAQGFEQMYEKLLASIELVAGGSGAGNRVDTIMGRSTMAEYEPDYPMPPPRVMPRRVSIDGTPADEAQADN